MFPRSCLAHVSSRGVSCSWRRRGVNLGLSCCGCGCGCGSSEYTKRLNKMQNKGDHPPNVAVKRFLDQIDEGHQRNISDRPQPIVFRTCCYFISRRCLPAKSFSKMILRAPYFSGNSLKRDSIARRCIIQNVGAPPGPHQDQGHAARAGSGAEAAARMPAGPPPQGAALPRAPQQHHRCRARGASTPLCAGRGRLSSEPSQASQPVMLSVGPLWPQSGT